jgi:hypothetical protein
MLSKKSRDRLCLGRKMLVAELNQSDWLGAYVNVGFKP